MLKLVVRLATPLLFTATLLPITLAPSLNVTVPLVTALVLVTVAVNVVVLPGNVVNEGLLLDVSVVVVLLKGITVTPDEAELMHLLDAVAFAVMLVPLTTGVTVADHEPSVTVPEPISEPLL